MDQPFDIPASGQADWDSGLQSDLNAIERGYYLTERAGQEISSGQVLTLNSGGFFFPYNPNSATIAPHGYSFTAAASGDSLTAVAWGIVRSLDINSPAVPGKLAYATESGFLTTTALGLPVGAFLTGRGVLFNPSKAASGGGGGVTRVTSLSDVNPAGLADGSILKWSDATSKFTMQVDSSGGGGGGGSNPDYLPTSAGYFPVVVNTITLTDAPQGLGLNSGINGGTAMYAAVRSIDPTVNHTIIARFRAGIPTDTTMYGGVLFWDTTSGGCGIGPSQDAADFSYWQVPPASGGHTQLRRQASANAQGGALWMKLHWVAATSSVIGQASTDGVNWTDIGTMSPAPLASFCGGFVAGQTGLNCKAIGAITYWSDTAS